MALEVNKSETSSPNLATSYNRFTQCKPWPILLIIVSSNFVLKLKDRIGQTIKKGCFYDGLAREKKTPRHFMNIRERPLTVHEDKGLETNALKHDRTHLLGVHNRLNVYENKESFQQCTWGDTCIEINICFSKSFGLF